MRGRKPRSLTIAPEDRPWLHYIARSRTLPFFQVQHARIVLAVAAGQRIQTVAFQMQCAETTVWRVCRRYEQSGVPGLLADQARPGRPQRLSPPCSARKSCNWLAWNPWPRACTLRIGPVTT
jgi:hypothetical protein